MAELNIKEAREIYNNFKRLREKVTQEEFDKAFLELLSQCAKTVFFDAHGNECTVPSNRIELRNDSNKWMFDIQFTGENRHFWVNYCRVWSIFESRYGLQDDDIERLMKNQMKIRFGLDDITPSGLKAGVYMAMKIRFGLDDITPTGAAPRSV